MRENAFPREGGKKLPGNVSDSPSGASYYALIRMSTELRQVRFPTNLRPEEIGLLLKKGDYLFWGIAPGVVRRDVHGSHANIITPKVVADTGHFWGNPP